MKDIKCLVWDLDNTLWSGVLLEGDDVRLRRGAAEVLRTLDDRGILHSIASRNEPGQALGKLEELGLHEYFLLPQISWGSKSQAVRAICEQLDIGEDAIAFIDDDPFERDEVAAAMPAVLCLDAADLVSVPDLPRMNPRVITRDSRERRSMYQAEIARRKTEAVIPPDSFLDHLGMVFTISEAAEGDVDRVEELTVRTHQLNSTGYTYSHEELDAFRRTHDHRLLVAELDDRYGTYGKIGVALIATGRRPWLLKLLLMSCRVMARGVGVVMLGHILRLAAAARVPVQAEFIRTDRNRMMYLTLKLSGFREVERRGDVAVLQHDLTSIDPYPDHVEVRVVEPTPHGAMTRYRIERYRPELLEQVLRVEAPVWGAAPAGAAAVFDWKYQCNPYITEPLVYVALCEDRVVGVRGMFGTCWEVGTSGKRIRFPASADLMIDPDHRDRDLFRMLTEYPVADLGRLGYTHLVNLNPTPANYVTSVMTLGWRAIGSAGLLSRRIPIGASRRILQNVVPRAGLFSRLDRGATREGDTSIALEERPRVQAMADLVRRLDGDERLRHVRDETYLAWRFDCPMSCYRFLYREGGQGRIDGYLVLQGWHGGSVVNIVDWQGTDSRIRSALLDSALRWGRFRDVSTWSGTLPEDDVASLHGAGFGVTTQYGALGRYGRTLVRAVGSPAGDGGLSLEGRRLDALGSWDLRMLSSECY